MKSANKHIVIIMAIISLALPMANNADAKSDAAAKKMQKKITTKSPATQPAKPAAPIAQKNKTTATVARPPIACKGKTKAIAKSTNPADGMICCPPDRLHPKPTGTMVNGQPGYICCPSAGHTPKKTGKTHPSTGKDMHICQ